MKKLKTAGEFVEEMNSIIEKQGEAFYIERYPGTLIATYWRGKWVDESGGDKDGEIELVAHETCPKLKQIDKNDENLLLSEFRVTRDSIGKEYYTQVNAQIVHRVAQIIDDIEYGIYSDVVNTNFASLEDCKAYRKLTD